MVSISVFLTFVFTCFTLISAQVEYCDLYPPEVQLCMKDSKYHPVSQIDAHAACVRQFYVDTEPDLNLTKSDWDFFNYRLKTKFGSIPPESGFRIRKEYRRLTKEERIRLHSAFNILYQKGILHRFGRLHASASRSIHRGASFLPWHRVFITDLEEELRKIDPKVSLPYWDVTMDVNMTKPSDSVVWSPCFFGNGNGTIISGPFRGWYGGRNGPIQRDYAREECASGRLINKYDILNILSKCRLEDISVPPEEGTCKMEILHDGIHNWIGGDIGDLGLSAFDPIFYFIHAFVDYIWELFRRNQVLKCGVDPETDYPIDIKAADHDRHGHNAYDRMYGYEHLRNVDGLSHIFIDKFYKYETTPQCPDCGSTYLYCDQLRQICVSRDIKACDIPRGRNTYVNSGIDVNVGFTGTVTPALHPFPVTRPFPKRLPGLSRERRHRDMSLEEAAEIQREEEGLPAQSKLLAPFSPSLALTPSMSGSNMFSYSMGKGLSLPTPYMSIFGGQSLQPLPEPLPLSPVQGIPDSGPYSVPYMPPAMSYGSPLPLPTGSNYGFPELGQLPLSPPYSMQAPMTPMSKGGYY